MSLTWTICSWTHIPVECYMQNMWLQGFAVLGCLCAERKKKNPHEHSGLISQWYAVLFYLSFDLYSKRCRNQQAGLGKMLLRSQSWHDVYPSIFRSSSGLLFFLFLYTLLGGKGSSRVLLVVNDLDLQSARCEGEMCGEGRWTFD